MASLDPLSSLSSFEPPLEHLESSDEAVPTLSVMILAGGQSRRMGQDKALLATPNGQPLLCHTIQVAQQLATDRVVVVTPWPDRYQALVPPQVQLIHEQVALFAGSAASESAGPSAGPLSGFAQGWMSIASQSIASQSIASQAIASQWCLLLACDMPYLQSEPLQQWWSWLTMQDTQPRPLASLVRSSVPSANGRADKICWEPLCGFYHRRCVPGLIDYLQGLEPQQSSSRQSSSQQSSSRQPSRRSFQARSFQARSFQARSFQARSFQAWLKTLPIAAYSDLPPRLLFNCNTPEDWAVAQQNFDDI
jgi:molybdenum cofactor guanylyltransferase